MARKVRRLLLGNNRQVPDAASEAGLSVNVDSAAGGTVMQLVQLEDRSACNITVIDTLDAKTLNCADQ